MKKLAALLLTAALLLQIPFFGGNVTEAAYITPENAAATLNSLGLFKDDGSGGFNLNKVLTRQEGIVMLCQLIGLEDWNNPGGGKAPVVYENPFTDIAPWAQGYIGHAYSVSLVRGTDNKLLGANSLISQRDWATFLLRALGYSDPQDFEWSKAVDFASSKGIIFDDNGSFTRGDAIVLGYEALLTKMNGSDTKLIETLVASGAVSRASLKNTPFAGYANYGKTVFGASEIYERSSAATFLMLVYGTEERLADDSPDGTASGFFISQDGLALISYHAIERMPYATIETADGHVFSDIKVLWRDGWRDLALIKVGKTDVDGVAVSGFPYLALGDSDYITPGEQIYVMGSPIGLTDSISNGIISAKAREVYGPGYPEMQFTAAVSPGSSGGPVINRYGEVVGVVRGAFTSGNDLNLAVPVNFLPDEARNAAGITLKQAADEDDALNEAATLAADLTSISVKEGETVKIVITRDNPGSFVLQYHILDSTVCAAAWGDYISITDTELYIKGVAPGKTTVTVSYANATGNPDAKIEIAVRVVAAN